MVEEEAIYIIDEELESEEDISSLVSLKLGILSRLDLSFPGKYFIEGINFSTIDLTKIADYALSNKCVFETLVVGDRILKKVEGGAIRSFKTNEDQVACTLNFLSHDSKKLTYKGDILNLLFNNEKDLKLLEVDFLVESKYFSF